MYPYLFAMKAICTFLILLIAATAYSQKTDKKLERKIAALVAGFNGEVGVYVKDLEKNRVASVNADTVFPTASMIKIPIMLGVMQQIENGTLSMDQQLEYHDSLLYAGVDILGSFKTGEKIELGKVMMLMLTMSDNTASLWLQRLAGTGTRINALLDSMGYAHTRVNSRTAGRQANWQQSGWGQTTPREMATIMEQIANGRMISSRASDRMLRMLGRNYWDDVALSQIPPGTFVASKNGAVNQSRSEVVYVNADEARYIFCIASKNNADQSWKHDNEAWVLTRKLSKLLWEYYNK